jgi:hypothetical protein
LTPKEATTRRAIATVEAMFTAPPMVPPWEKRKRDGWLKALRGIDPEAVEWAADELIRTWTSEVPPPVGRLRELAVMRQKRGPMPKRDADADDAAWAERARQDLMAFART